MKDRDKTVTPQKPQTLADWALSFGPGSPCFCCGARLEAHAASEVLAAELAEEDRLLRCPHCGTEIEDCEQVEPLPSMSDPGEARRQLPAAA